MTTLTLVPFLDPSYAGHLITSDYVAMQQVSPQEAELGARLFRLSPQDVAALPSLLPELALWTARHGQAVRVLGPDPGRDRAARRAPPDGLIGHALTPGPGERVRQLFSGTTAIRLP